MIYLLLFIVAIISASLGFIIAGILAAGKRANEVQAAYNYGLEEGKRIAMQDVENLYNKYKDMANVNNDI